VNLVLGVDGGNTNTTAVLATTDGDLVGVGRGGCSDIYGAGSVDAGTAVLADTVETAFADAGTTARAVAGSVLSLAGADWPEDLRLLEAFARDRLGLAAPLVVNDAIGAIRSGSATWEGIAVVCGTFNAVGARHRSGAVFHLGFWPDRTGSYDLSTAALKAVYRAGLGLGPETALTARALATYGADDPLELLHHFTRRGHPGMGELVRMTPIVLDAAAHGDDVAVAIVADAGRMLGDEARVAAQRVELPLTGTPVVLSGGVLSHRSSVLVDRIMDRLDGAVAVRTGVPPVVGAVLLAIDRAGGPAAGPAVGSRLGSALAALATEPV
jgi:N-acetylglucosamine kinase-like BadF-type ATPase